MSHGGRPGCHRSLRHLQPKRHLIEQTIGCSFGPCPVSISIGSAFENEGWSHFERVVNFEQTGGRSKLFNIGTQRGRRNIGYGNVTALKRDKHKEYARYAAHCLEMPVREGHDARTILREMAAEWLKLADGALHSSRRQQTQKR